MTSARSYLDYFEDILDALHTSASCAKRSTETENR